MFVIIDLQRFLDGFPTIFFTKYLLRSLRAYCWSVYLCIIMKTDENIDHSIADLRRIYQQKSLSETEVDQDPIVQFRKWWNEAIAAQIPEPNAMTLATCIDGKPSARTVLLKDIHADGILFFTNYNSRKGKEIEANPYVALLFFWQQLERQVRIDGMVEKISAKISDEYFASRPRESRIGAWSSPQSETIENRKMLEEKEKYYESLFENKEIPRPEHWGGYLVRPISIEFWQGRPGRLHDRIYYIKEGGSWKINRLAP